MIPYKQLSMVDIFTDCQNKFEHDKYQFLDMLQETIHLNEIVPSSFVSHFHTYTGRLRVYKALIPVLKDFFAKHPLINPKTFLSDAAFDTIQIYHDLFHELKFQTAYIPLNNRLSIEDSD